MPWAELPWSLIVAVLARAVHTGLCQAHHKHSPLHRSGCKTSPRIPLWLHSSSSQLKQMLHWDVLSLLPAIKDIFCNSQCARCLEIERVGWFNSKTLASAGDRLWGEADMRGSSLLSFSAGCPPASQHPACSWGHWVQPSPWDKCIQSPRSQPTCQLPARSFDHRTPVGALKRFTSAAR